MKSNIEQTQEIITRANVKEIKELFHNENYNCSTYSDNASVLIDLIIANSNDFTKDIATRIEATANEGYLSAKQAWCLAYQVVNNLEVYKEAINNYGIEIEDLGFELEDFDNPKTKTMENTNETITSASFYNNGTDSKLHIGIKNETVTGRTLAANILHSDLVKRVNKEVTNAELVSKYFKSENGKIVYVNPTA